MAQTKISTVQIDDGVNFHVKIIGKKPRLSTHAESEASFGHLFDKFRVLVFDGRGSGSSDLVGAFTHDRWIKDIENLKRWAGAEKFVLTGASYGGFLALDYALGHGDQLLGLVLRDTWANGLFDFEDSVLEILPFYAPPEDVVPSSALPESTEFPGSVKFHSATQNAVFGFNMPRFDVPTLVIVGRHDNVTPVSSSEEIAKGIPSARLEIFELSGHSPPSDEPEKFNQILCNFLEGQVLSKLTT